MVPVAGQAGTNKTVQKDKGAKLPIMGWGDVTRLRERSKCGSELGRKEQCGHQ